MVCMMCGKPGDLRDIDEDAYKEYDSIGKKFWVGWVYCEPCDCWTQHPIEREIK